jgi:hypothetical protein
MGLKRKIRPTTVARFVTEIARFMIRKKCQMLALTISVYGFKDMEKKKIVLTKA